MTGHQQNGDWVIWCSLFVALLLTITPLPHALMDFRPLWVALFFIYWTIALPHRISLLAAWLIGILLDVLLNTLLGQNALVLVFVVYITLLFQHKIRPQPILKQSLIITIILFLAQLLQLWIYILTGSRPSYMSVIFPVIISAIIWPWLAAALRALQTRMSIH